MKKRSNIITGKVIVVLDFDNGIIGKITLKLNSYHNSTLTFMKREYRCYLQNKKVDCYLTSFDSLGKSLYYLKNLHRNRYQP